MSKKKKLRGAVVSALSLSMALSSMSAVSAQSVNDVQGHWAEQQIQSWIENGSLKGYQDGSVKPNNSITRAEFVTLVNRMFGFTDTTAANFKDLSPSNWAYNDVAKALNAGYVKGYSDNTFHPSSNVSRQEAAIMISSILGLDTSSIEGIRQFTDAGKIPAWSQGSIAAVIEKEIMKGYPDGTFQAQKQLTRAEAVVLIDSAMSNREFVAETVTIDQAGVYGSAQETKIVNGNVIINVPGVTLENYEIKGNLLLAEGIGSGDVTIKNVKVHGNTNVEGGGENSIHFVDSVLVNVLVNKKDGTVRLVAEGTTTAQKVIVQSSAKLEESNLNGEGFTDVELAKELPANATVQLNGKFDDVDLFSASVTVKLLRGSIQDVTIDAGAANNTIQLSSGSQVVNMVLNAISKILGASNITTVTLNSGSQNSTFDARPSNVQGDQSGSIIVNAPSTPTSSPSGGSSSGGSSSGGSGGGSTGGGDQTKITYTVTFNLNGAGGITPAASTVEAGKTVTLPAEPTREGYTFTGWNTEADGSGNAVDGTTAITANTTLYAQWEAQLVAPDGLSELEVPNFTATGAKFLVFGLNKEGSNAQQPSTLEEVKTYINGKYGVAFNTAAIQLEDGKISITDSILSTADWNKVKTNGDKTVPYRITLLNDAGVKVAKIAMYQDGKAVIESLQVATKYTVSYDLNGGEGTAPAVTVEAGKTVTLPAEPTREGYTFTGWNTEADGSGNAVDGTTAITANTTLYAQWEAQLVAPDGLSKLEVSNFTAAGAKFLVFGLNKEGSNSQQPSTLEEVKTYINGKYGVAFNTAAIQLEDGKISITDSILSTADWNKVKTNGDKTAPYRITLLNDAGVKVAKIAMYQDGKAVIESLQVATKYTVSYDLNGGEGTAPAVTVEAGKTVTLPAEPTREGYTFTGWNTEADGSGNAVDGTTAITADTTLYAQWEAQLVAPDGLSELGVPNFTAAGAKFLVFGLNKEGSNAQQPSTLGEVKTYINEKYDVTFNTAAIQLEDGKITITGSPLSTADWNKVKTNGDKTAPYRITLLNDAGVKVAKIAMYQDGNAVIELIQTAVTKYTVSYDLNGSQEIAPEASVVEAGKTVVLPANPTREGYSFVGWNTKADGSGTVVDGTTAITANTTLYAQWEAQLVAPDGLSELEVSNFTAAGAKFLVFGLNKEGSNSQQPSTLEDVKTYINGKYEVTFNAGAIQLEDGKITITGSPLSTADWNKVKTNGDKTVPYRITLLNDAGVKVAKIAMYQDGKAVIESLQVATKYTVSYDLNGGEGTAPAVTVEAGKTVTLPAEPTREGYTFTGWNTEVDGSGTVVDGTTAITANTTLYAQWEAQLVAPDGLSELEVSDFTATEAKFLVFGLNKEGGNAQQPSTLEDVKTYINGKYGVAFNTAAIQLEDGKISITDSILSTADWNKVKTNGDKTAPYRITFLNDAGVKVAKIAMYQDGNAVIELIQTAVTKYTVSYDLNGSQEIAPEASVVEAGKTVVLPANPTREGYSFVGWNTKEDGSGTAVDGTTAITADTTLYAQWEAQLVAPDGLSELGVPNFTAAGAKFLVFGLNKEGSNAQQPSTLGEVKTYINEKYDVTFNTAAIQLEDGKITITGSPLSTADWNKVKTNGDKTAPYRITLLNDAGVKVAKIAMYQDGNAVIELIQTAVTKYTVSYDLNGSQEIAPEASVVEAGKTVVLPAAPTREGYTFTGWNTEADGSGNAVDGTTAITADTTLYAQWEEAAPSNEEGNNTPEPSNP